MTSYNDSSLTKKHIQKSKLTFTQKPNDYIFMCGHPVSDDDYIFMCGHPVSDDDYIFACGFI